MRRSLPRRVRSAVLRRAGHRCEYCLCPLSCSPSPFAIDHILPLTRGGTDDPANLALACFGCNGPKSAFVEGLDPTTGIAVPLYNPRRDRWRDHFRWNDDFTRIEGVTSTGRATVAQLDLNRPGVVTLRRLMRGTEENHPPSWTLPETDR